MLSLLKGVETDALVVADANACDSTLVRLGIVSRGQRVVSSSSAVKGVKESLGDMMLLQCSSKETLLSSTVLGFL